MSHEASKTREVRGRGFAEKYLRGCVIDIGCGPDLVVPGAEPFDLEHGDAQEVASIRPNEAYDAVCSSHCLEHMRDVPAALQQWWRLVKPGGFLVIVVPDEDLYEQGSWPSLFNSDHKATFRWQKPTSWSPMSYDLVALMQQLDGAEIVNAERQMQGYDARMMKSGFSNGGRTLFRIHNRFQAVLRKVGAAGGWLDRMIAFVLFRLGMPIDQTAGVALAQIQVIARKQIQS